MNSRNSRYTVRLAGPQDNAGIREIFESGSFSGGIDLQYLRGDAPFDSLRADGDDVRILTADDNETGRLAAVGGAVLRTEYLNGIPARCAYLTGLKIHPDYQGKFYRIAESYQFLGQQLQDCACCYTTVLDDNERVIRMFEKHHRNMPEYRYLGHYTTYCFHGGKKLLPLRTDRTADFEPLLHMYYSQFALTPCRPDYAGFGRQRFFSYSRKGELIACCYVGDQSRTKQYKICSYGGIYKTLAKLPVQLLGYPKLPEEGSIIHHGVVSYLYVRDNDPVICRRFLRSVAAAAGFSVLIWGGFETHPLCKALNKMRTIHYGSRLYEVLWDGAAPAITGKIGMEAALL